MYMFSQIRNTFCTERDQNALHVNTEIYLKFDANQWFICRENQQSNSTVHKWQIACDTRYDILLRCSKLFHELRVRLSCWKCSVSVMIVERSMSVDLVEYGWIKTSQYWNQQTWFKILPNIHDFGNVLKVYDFN